jgi:hypothetical protein
MTPEQLRTIALKEKFAQHGIIYDKATRRFLEAKPQEEDPRPTIKLLPVAIDQLLTKMNSL